MNIEKLTTKIQSFLGVSKPELTAVIILLSGVLIAYPAKQIYKEQVNSAYNSSEFYSIFDSLATVSRTSYIGSTVNGESDPQLSKADTVIEKESLFGTTKKKELNIDTKISLNSASKTELMKLPGIGASTAIKIINYRTISPFKQISDVKKVKGIGEKKFDKMQAFLKL
jgi:competence ComEA-like helix-hairpin-helix protein